MSFIRKGVLVVFSFLFFLCLLISGLFLVFYLSLDYDSVNAGLNHVVMGLPEGETILQEISSQKPMFEIYCLDNSEFSFSNPFTNEVENISCVELLDDTEGFINNRISKTIQKKYYDEYDCGFFDCLEKTKDPFSLISKNALNYWKAKFFYSLIALFLLAIIIFLLVENKSNFFILSSLLFAFSSIVLFKLNVIVGIIFDFFRKSIEIGALSPSLIPEIFSLFLSKSSFVFVVFICVAALFLASGVIMKIFGISLWFKWKSESEPDSKINFSEKDKKTISVKKRKTESQ